MRSTPGVPALSLVLASAMWLVAGCSFDTSAFDARPACATDGDCPSGTTCYAGSCTPVATLDDAGIDTGDGTADGLACTPNQRTCVGDQLEVCDPAGSELEVTDCTRPSACPGGFCTCRDGACTQTICTPETTQCDGNTVETCDADGTAYVDTEVCDVTEVCVGGVCAVATCTANTVACAGDTIVRCDAGGIPTVVTDCTASNGYCHADPEPRCEPRNCAPGSTRCADADTVEFCDPRGIGYSEAADCLDGQYCAEGVCLELACVPGEQLCVGADVYGTCRADGQPPDLTPCDDGTYCRELAAGVITCAPQVCTPGDQRCRDGVTLEQCDERGAGYATAVACADAQYCSGDLCRDRVCAPATSRCVGGFSIAACDELGAEETLLPCGAGTYCDDAAGNARCAPQTCAVGARRCAGTAEVEECDERGAAYVVIDTCDPGFVCESATCTPTICAPDAITCASGTTVQTCNALGTGASITPCPDGRYCGDGVCRPQVCTPDQAFCDGDNLLRCNAAGSASVVAETCSFGCVGGACASDACGNSIVGPSEACDDGSANPCDGCDACRVPRTATLSGSTRTTSSTAWAPATTDFTFEAWILPQADDGAWFGVGERSATDFVWAGVAGGRPRFEIAVEAGAVLRLDATRTVRDGLWHHIAFERFSIWGLAIWVDGTLAGFSHAPVAQRSIDGDRRIWIGSDGATSPAPAQIDELRISLVRRYTVPFAPPRLLASDGNTLALYRFDEASGSSTGDASGNGRTLDVTGLTRTADDCRATPASAVTCGDGSRAHWEECDDGNASPSDGCSGCRAEVCGTWTRGPGDRCYLLDTARAWSGARDACRGAGGDLVTIDNEAENDWLVYMFDLPAVAWIGLNDRSTEDSFVWSAGSSAYRAWASGEPNNGASWTGQEDCVQLYPAAAGAPGQWNDEDCGGSVRAICERAP